MQSLYVGLFGVLGCVSRYWLSSWIHQIVARPIPFGTLAVNVAGSLLIGIRTYQALGCSGAARVDFRIPPKGKPFVLEINTVPGMTETSLLPMAAGKAGLSYDALTERILQAALGRAGVGSFRAVR